MCRYEFLGVLILMLEDINEAIKSRKDKNKKFDDAILLPGEEPC